MSRNNSKRGFTLIELLVSISIITILMSLLLAGLRTLRGKANALDCLTRMRAVVMDFSMFADPSTAEYRGRSEACRNNEFYFEDFADKQYRVDEFWEGTSRARQRMRSSIERMMCPAGPSVLERVPDRPCNDGALEPFDNVSMALNRRLFADTIVFNGRMVFNPDTKVTSRLLEHPHVPIVFDSDGELATSRGRRPYFSAPGIDGHDDMYSNNEWWFPSTRHLGRMNVGLVDGSVHSTEEPLKSWDWTYQASSMENIEGPE